jgi:hypothetical protein
VPQASFCLSSNHVRCPLYTGEELSSTQVAPVVTPLPQGGFSGWLSGLSARDRRIYAILVGLLGLIILAYVVSGVVLFSGDQEPTTVAVFTPTAPVALTTATSVPPTAAPSGTPNRFATAAVQQTQTAEARGSATLDRQARRLAQWIAKPIGLASRQRNHGAHFHPANRSGCSSDRRANHRANACAD